MLNYHQLTSNSSDVLGTSFNTASVSLAADRLALVAVVESRNNYGTAAPPTGVSGAGRTFTKIAHVILDANYSSLSLWRSTGSAGSGAITISFDADRDTCAWAVLEVSGTLNLTNNGADTLGTAATNTGSGTSLGVTLGAFADAANGAIALFGAEYVVDGTVTTFTQDSGWSEVYDLGIGGTTYSEALQVQFRASNDTTAATTTSQSATLGGIAVEIKAATTVDVAGSVAATATVTGSGASTQDANASASAIATVAGAGASTQDADVSASASATVTGSGASTQDADVSVASAAAVSFVSEAFADAAFSIDGALSVGFEGESFQDGSTFSVASSATVEFEGASTQDAAGYCEVQSEVLGSSEEADIRITRIWGNRRKRHDDLAEITEILELIRPLLETGELVD